MSTEHHYRSNLRDTFFNLFEFLDTGRNSLGHAPFDALDEQTARESLKAIEKICATEVAASFGDADRHPAHMTDDGRVVLPESLQRSLRAFYEGDWHRFSLPQSMGGVGAPPSLAWASYEMVSGANGAASFFLAGPMMVRSIDRLTTDAQRGRYIPQMIDRGWNTAMVLTEPDAGSDVGAARARAVHVKDDEWHIEGVKRFITNGDYEGPENIVHIVLARPDGGPVGTKGLSMFLVPKYWVEKDGSLGRRNGWSVTRLEKKMGIRSSVTCEVHYGESPAARCSWASATTGSVQMFHIIEGDRMAIGVKSMGRSRRPTSRPRVHEGPHSGTRPAARTDKNAPRVQIIKHPRRAPRAHEPEGLRRGDARAHPLDRVDSGPGRDPGGHSDKRAAELDALNDISAPAREGVVVGGDDGFLSSRLQCLGGSGYCDDYPMEQYIRDQKIDTLYEGTTHIQALDLFFRKVARDGGATLQKLLGQVRASLEGELSVPALAKEHAALTKALADVEGIFMAMLGKVGESLYHAGLQGNRVLFALGELVSGWLVLRHAALALTKRDGASETDRAYYDGKVATARWWAANVLPGIGHARELIEASTLDLMDVSDDAF
ncbi:MAG: acyl-CoA dehydrogenase [Polyangiales bacterium]